MQMQIGQHLNCIKSEYIDGFDDVRIRNMTNSSATLAKLHTLHPNRSEQRCEKLQRKWKLPVLSCF